MKKVLLLSNNAYFCNHLESFVCREWETYVRRCLYILYIMCEERKRCEIIGLWLIYIQQRTGLRTFYTKKSIFYC